MQGLTKGQIAVAVLTLVVAVSAVLAHWVGTALSCAWDTSYCAQSIEKDGTYQGVLRTSEGRLYRSSEFQVSFESRSGLPDVSFRTDEKGRYCFGWAAERSGPFVTTPAGQPLFGRDEEDLPGLGAWRDLEGRPPPPGCQKSDEAIPWNRASDMETTWQYWVLIILPGAAIAALLAALIGRRSQHALPLLVSGSALLAVDLVTFAILWRIV